MPRIISIKSGDIDLTRWAARELGFSNPIIGHVINVSSDSTLKGKDTVFAPLDYILNPSIPYWNSAESNSEHWYQIDFQSLNIILKGYSFHIGDAHYSRSWQVKGINDSHVPIDSWTLVDSKKLDQIPEQIRNTYWCENPQSFRFIRFITSSLNFENKSYMSFTRLYLYGDLIWSSCTTISAFKIRIKFFVFLVIMSKNI